MPQKEFVMRGQTASGVTEVLNFGGKDKGYAYRLTELQIYPSTGIGSGHFEMTATVTASKTAMGPQDPDFNDEGLIASCKISSSANVNEGSGEGIYVVNDTFLITQDLLLIVHDTYSNPVNWQCRFVMTKMTGPEEAATNYKQFTISDA